MVVFGLQVVVLFFWTVPDDQVVLVHSRYAVGGEQAVVLSHAQRLTLFTGAGPVCRQRPPVVGEVL